MARIFCAVGVACGLVLAGAPAFAPAALAQGAQPQPAPAPSVQTRKKTKLGQPAAKAKPDSHAKREPKGFIETITQGPRLTTTPPEPADWVRQSRGAQTGAPAGLQTAVRGNAPAAAAPARRLLTADEIRAKEAALDSARVRHDKVAGRKNQTGKLGSAAGKPEVATAEKPKPGCVLTCATPIGVPRTQRR
ncbi:MAG: hypothetical protein K2Y29_20860 [Beijerinckiaceae bacterium]|nr:hypothetical protein [Beijerinckiaceae bacterium]